MHRESAPRSTAAASSESVWPALHDAQRTVLLEILIHGSRSRADLARRTGLSRTSLSRLTKELVALGLVSEGQIMQSAGRGRPSEMVDLVPESAHFVGVKLTGEALYAVVTDLSARVLRVEERPLLSREVEDVVALIADLVAGFRDTYDRVSAVGVCLAGDVRWTRRGPVVVGSHFLGWDDVALAELVAARTGLPVSVANDVQALTAAQHWFGAGVGSSSMVLVGLGAGIGAGIVVGDELVRGSRGHPGKVGHIPVRPDGPFCDRGHRGCASAFVTIPALLANSGEDSFDDLLAGVARGSGDARRAVDEAGYALGVVVAQLTNLVDPEIIIITGEGRAIADLAADALAAGMTAQLDPASEAVTPQVQDFEFADYAWAAAISAIRHVAS